LTDQWKAIAAAVTRAGDKGRVQWWYGNCGQEVRELEKGTTFLSHPDRTENIPTKRLKQQLKYFYDGESISIMGQKKRLNCFD
jgi:hypothetical protein